ncbi:MAG: hypothetical protein JNJ77_19845 [Planctomycetia bacterium]|nr:hypothetical protein [Planctomycetia bacterium]
MQFPVYTITDKSRHDDKDPIYGVVSIEIPPHGKTIPLFSNKDLCLDLIRMGMMPDGFVPMLISSDYEFQRILSDAAKHGARHTITDPAITTDGGITGIVETFLE